MSAHYIRVYSTTFTDVEDEECVDPDTDHEDHDCEPDEFDADDGYGPVELAAAFLADQGITCPSSMPGFHAGIWYTLPDGSYVSDYRTGERCAQSAHLEGFSEDEQRRVWEIVCR